MTLPIGLSYVLFFAFVRRIVVSAVVWSLSAVGFLFSPWSCHRYVTHRHLVCVVFAFVRRIMVPSVLWSLSAVSLFVPCIVVADPIGCLSYSRLVRRNVEFRHFL